ncbi:MAG: phosphate propanoyltransferase [Candidatus Woesearchaeota archaeon]
MKVPIEISARHVHLSKDDLYKLFGKNYILKIKNQLSQPGQFAAKETLTIKNGKNIIENVRIIGPCRNISQVEISKTDAIKLKLNPPVRVSGDIDGTPGLILIGPKGKMILKKGVIIAKRHLHISPEEAKKNNLLDKQIISIKVAGERSIVYNEVIVRSRENIDKLSFQLDTDEANAGGIQNGDYGEIV